MEEGGRIINTTSVTAFKGSPMLVDYSATKGAIVAFTRSLALSLAKCDILDNAVASVPVWTPLSRPHSPRKVESFGKDVLLQRAGHPVEIAHRYVFLASDGASFMIGQVCTPMAVPWSAVKEGKAKGKPRRSEGFFFFCCWVFVYNLLPKNPDAPAPARIPPESSRVHRHLPIST